MSEALVSSDSDNLMNPPSPDSRHCLIRFSADSRQMMKIDLRWEGCQGPKCSKPEDLPVAPLCDRPRVFWDDDEVNRWC